MKHKLKMIAVTQENYQVLKKMGGAGDSFNSVITNLLKQIGAVKLEA
jgi:predicted CopG family antitoxin